MKKIFVSTALISTLVFGNVLLPYAEEEKEITLETSNQEITAQYSVMGAGEAKSIYATPTEKEKVQSVFKEEGLTPLKENEIAENALVMNFDSIEEFEKFLAETKEPLEISLNEEKQNSGIMSLINSYTVDAATRKTFKGTHKQGQANINIYADVTKGSNGKISSVKVSTGMTGFTNPWDWKQRSATYSLSSTKLSGTARASGDLTLVVFVKGIGSVWTETRNLKVSFWASKI